jgi:23S rRNA pseudouridine1911/1915/1917 synthase
MLAYRNCKCAEQLKFTITICGSYNMGKPDIIYEDNDIIICYKPAGIATQTRRIGQQDMESFIRNYRAAKNEPPYVGIVHRLDQPVEGVMVFAKNQKAAASLSRQIKEHTTEKYYRAASRGQGVSGADKEEANKEDNHDLAWHTLTDYISFDKRTNTSKITSEKDRLAKKAVLQYRVISVTPDRDSSQNECIRTDFDIKLLTGRHHQIRLQLANIGYPLIGDTKYGGDTAREQLALCSYKIVFDHPATGERMTFELP